MEVAYRDMFHVTKLYSYISRGGRLVAKSVIAQVGTHAFLFKSSSLAPVLDPPSAWCGWEIIDDPDDDDGAKVRERVFYRGSEQAADGNEKENKK